MQACSATGLDFVDGPRVCRNREILVCPAKPVAPHAGLPDRSPGHASTPRLNGVPGWGPLFCYPEQDSASRVPASL
ncbi:hypothetical protein J2S97_004482 [Arthrobacter oryzae]|nr:hypothetical protein [Arthrobacter oryzae]